MCGIFGQFGGVDNSSMAISLSLLRHRGPDGKGMFIDEEARVALGHTRLSIIDLSEAARQPMVSECESVVVVFNGEIYNFRELRADLSARGFKVRSTSDTEVLMNMYIAYGERMLTHLRGIFAFAIWDRRNRTALIARDSLGVKPIYYVETGNRIAFSSEIKALLGLHNGKPQINPQALRDHLTYLWSPAPRTIFQGVLKLQPGHLLRVSEGRCSKPVRWAPIQAARPSVDVTELEAITSVRAGLETAVTRQLVADVPIGAFLSGGIDSSTVCAIARKHVPADRLNCFTIAANSQELRREGMTNDLPYARGVARKLGVTLHEVNVQPPTLENLIDCIWRLDEPTADLAPLNVFAISKLARDHGIKVLLSGAGGDDIFSGYRRHFTLAAEQYLKFLPVFARNALARSSRLLPTSLVFTRRLRKALHSINLRNDLRVANLFEWAERGVVDQLLAGDILEASRRPNPLLQSLDNLPPGTTWLNKMLHLECQHFLADHNLNYTDKMGMAAGVEVRVPLLDEDLVNLAFSLPNRYKLRGAQGKWVLCEAVRGLVPDDVLSRPKTGFGLPLRHWLRGPMQAEIRDVFSSATFRQRGLFNEPNVNALLEAELSGRVDGSYVILSILFIELWCRVFLDGASPSCINAHSEEN
jgi:asparagine synthase (glutamine-hydrolysing)